MTTFAEQLKTLSVPELEKLKRILMLLAQDANHGFDELLEQIRAPKSALSQSDADLIDSELTSWKSITTWTPPPPTSRQCWNSNPAIILLGSAGILGIAGAILPLAMVVALIALELLVAFLQAYVFAILTCIYLNDAIHPGH